MQSLHGTVRVNEVDNKTSVKKTVNKSPELWSFITLS
jgi:hypothetical protein